MSPSPDTTPRPGFVLVLDPPAGDPGRRVGGLALALRLCLDAQSGGAIGVHLAEGAGAAGPLLNDPRLRLPILGELPSTPPKLRVPADFLMHRAQLKQIAERGLEPGSVTDLAAREPKLDADYGFAPLRVVDTATASRAERLLFRSLRKAADGWTSRHLNRYISLTISRWLVKTPLRPNQLSLLILAIGLFGAYLAARGDYVSMLAGAFLFQAQSVLDGCDGEISRVSYRGSLTGEWLDTVGDDLTNYAFFGAAGYGLYAAGGHVAYLIAALVAVGSGVIASSLEYRYLYSIGSGDLLKYPLSADDEQTQEGGLFAAIRPLFKRDTFVFLTFVAALFGLVGPMLLVFGVGAVGILVSVLLAELRMARERRAAGGGAR